MDNLTLRASRSTTCWTLLRTATEGRAQAPQDPVQQLMPQHWDHALEVARAPASSTTHHSPHGRGGLVGRTRCGEPGDGGARGAQHKCGMEAPVAVANDALPAFSASHFQGRARPSPPGAASDH